MSKKIAGIVAVLLVVLAGIMLIRYRKAQLARAPLPEKSILSVDVAKIEHGVFPEKRRFLGTIVAKTAADIAPRVTGHLVEVRVREGDRVKEGELLASVDDRLQRDKVAAVRAELAAARTARSTREAIYRRDEHLFEAKAISREALDLSLSARDAATAQVSSLEKGFHSVETDLSYTRLCAPFAGVMTGRLADPGDLAVPGRAVLSMEAPHMGYFVSVMVPQDESPLLRVGGRAFLGDEGQAQGRAVPAAVSRIHPSVQKGTLAAVEIDVAQRPFDLPTGSTLDVDLVLGEHEGWRLPPRALLESAHAAHVFLVDENDTIHIVPVQILAKGPGEVIAKGDFRGTPRAVVAGESALLRLHEAEKVRVEANR